MILLGFVVGAVGFLASAVGLYEAFASPDKHLYKIALNAMAKARSRRPPEIRTLVSSYELAVIPDGNFMMGTDPRVAPAQKAFSDEFPRHSVTISRPIMVGRNLVTRELWEAVMATGLRDRYAAAGGPRHPIVGISWFEAIRFCNGFSSHSGLTPVYSFSNPLAIEPEVTWDQLADGFRLPTEAEWEYFTRAGTVSPFWSGYSLSDLNNTEWTRDIQRTM